MAQARGRLDRCGAAHRSRQEVNAAGAERSLEDWALSLAPAKSGSAVLDLGCGEGKLALPYAAAVGRHGRVLGVDIAPDSLEALRRRAKEQGLANVDTRTGNLDTIVEELSGRRFDLIVSSYAIYYAKDMVTLLANLRGLLTRGGRLFVCGPGEGTNREMTELARSASGPKDVPPAQEDFISPEQIARAAQSYKKVETHRLANFVRFDTPEALLGWWRNHNSYVASADQAVERAVNERFAADGEFRLTKNVLGVLFRA